MVRVGSFLIVGLVFCTTFALLVESTEFSSCLNVKSSNLPFGKISGSCNSRNILFSKGGDDDDDKGGDPDAYVPHRIQVKNQGDDDDKGGDPDAYVPQGRYCNKNRMHLKNQGDDDDKGGDPDAYVPQGRFRNKMSSFCLHIRGGAGKGAKVTNSTASKPKGKNGKSK